jgi:hypothetical protein
MGDVCVGLVDTNPMQLERAQTDIVCSRYRDLFILPNRQKMMTVQSVQCHVAADCTGRTDCTCGIVGDDVVGSYN